MWEEAPRQLDAVPHDGGRAAELFQSIRTTSLPPKASGREEICHKVQHLKRRTLSQRATRKNGEKR
jgi:hypothetical protein